MRKILLGCVLLMSACTMDVKTNQQISDTIKKNLKAQSVDISDGVEANVGGSTGSKKEINVNITDNPPTNKMDLLYSAYNSVMEAYAIANTSHDKMPDIFRIKIKSGADVAVNLDYKTAYLSKSKAMQNQVNSFLNAVKQKQYQTLNNYLEPGLNITPIVNVFRRADASFGGIKAYQFVGLQHNQGVHKPDGKPMDVIEAWAVIQGSTKEQQSIMLFVFNPSSPAISSVYINPGNQK